MPQYRNPNEFYEHKDRLKGHIGSLIVHVLLLAALLAGLFNREEKAAGPVQIELWAEGTQKVLKPAAQKSSTTPADTDTRSDDAPESSPEDTAPDNNQRSQAAQKAAEQAAEKARQAAAEAQKQADIALSKKRQEQEAAKKKAEDERLKAEQQAKAQAEAKAKADAAAKAEADAKAKAEAQEKAKQAAAEKAAKEKAKKAEEAKKKEEAQRKKDAAEKAKKDAEAKKAQQNQSSGSKSLDDLKAAMRGDVNSTAGIKGGRNERNQLGGGGGSSAYIRAVQACVQPKLVFSGAQRLSVKYEVKLNGRTPVSAEIVRRSGNPAFDNAVKRALLACNPYPPNPPDASGVVKGTFTFPQ